MSERLQEFRKFREKMKTKELLGLVATLDDVGAL
jgi:hypothetical protein